VDAARAWGCIICLKLNRVYFYKVATTTKKLSNIGFPTKYQKLLKMSNILGKKLQLS